MLPAAPQQAQTTPEGWNPGSDASNRPPRRRTRHGGLFDPVQLLRSIPEAIRKLHPRALVRNPMLFVVAAGSVLMTLSALIHPSVFTWVISVWLRLTVIFANLAPRPSPRAVARHKRNPCAERVRTLLTRRCGDAPFAHGLLTTAASFSPGPSRR